MADNIRRIKLTDLLPDKRNANKHTERGVYMVGRSIEKLGLGRGILIDRDDEAIAGNLTLEQAIAAGFEDGVIVETDGKTLVITKRTDMDLDDPATGAREMAIVDNRTSEVSYDPDPVVIGEVIAEGIDLGDWFRDWELDGLFENMPDDDDWGAAFDKIPTEDRAPFQQMTFTLHDDQAEQVREALKAAKAIGPFVDTGNENSNGNALARVCELFMGDHGQG